VLGPLSRKLADQLIGFDPQLWPPVSCFPLWEARTESKMPLSRQPALTPDTLPQKRAEIRVLVKSFLSKYAPKKVIIPSALALRKVGSQKYNDEGEVRKDSEKPETSYSSGFLYQQFTTKHLQRREVWLPGKSIKNSNCWWFLIVDQLLRAVPYSALLLEPEEIYERVKPLMKSPRHLYFDISGYGIQYIREYLSDAIDEIVDFYDDNELLSEQARIAKEIFSHVDITFPDGHHEQPPRGIGLGYYENLKTLIVMAIIDHSEPISVFGDQAIMTYPQGADNRAIGAIKALADAGFIFSKESKVKVFTNSTFKWVGRRFNEFDSVEPRKVWTDIFGAWGKEFHWERKGALAGIRLPDEYKHVWKRVALQYELTFGYEFERGEAFNHPSQGGIYPEGQILSGWQPFFAPMHLRAPRFSWGSELYSSVPYGAGIDAKAAKKFQRSRVREFRKHRDFNSDIFYFSHPLVLPNQSKKVKMTPLARTFPLWADIRSLCIDGFTTGKVVSCLEGEDLEVAPYRQRYARDCFHARASGGYKIVTGWRCDRGASEEDQIVAEAVKASSLLYPDQVFRKDLVPNVAIDNDDIYKDAPNVEFGHHQNPYVASFIRNVLYENIEDDQPQHISYGVKEILGEDFEFSLERGEFGIAPSSSDDLAVDDGDVGEDFMTNELDMESLYVQHDAAPDESQVDVSTEFVDDDDMIAADYSADWNDEGDLETPVWIID